MTVAAPAPPAAHAHAGIACDVATGAETFADVTTAADTAGLMAGAAGGITSGIGGGTVLGATGGTTAALTPLGSLDSCTLD